MNGKRAKKLRQTVKHLMANGMVNSDKWIAYNPVPRNKSGLPGTVTLATNSGRAVYQVLKSREVRKHTP